MESGESLAEVGQCRGHMGTEVGFAKVETQVPVGPQSLHESLGRALPEDAVEFLSGDAFPTRNPMIEAEQLVPLPGRQAHVGIEEQGGQIVLGHSGSHPLEIDEDRLASG